MSRGIPGAGAGEHRSELVTGLAGVLCLDRRPYSPEEALERVVEPLGHRTNGTPGYWAKGPLAVAQLATFEHPQPTVVRSPSGRDQVVAVGDVRLDGRAGLRDALAASGFPVDPRVQDLELLATSYLAWGPEWPERVVGDYAAALWDTRIRTLHLVRDAFGTRPLFYHHANAQVLAFASEIKGLWRLPGFDPEPDEDMVAAYLGGVFHEREPTFTKGIRRLAAGTRLSCTDDGVSRTFQHWSPYDVPERQPGSEEEAVFGFRERFLTAVRDRLPSDGPIGSHLSGGVDSSSVSCAAAHLLPPRRRIDAYTCLFSDGERSDESRYVDQVEAETDVRVHRYPDATVDPVEALGGALRQQDQPFWTPMLLVFSHLYREAAADGISVMLDGMDGDSVAYQSYQRLRELFVTARWWTLGTELRRSAARTGRSPLGLLRGEVLSALLPFRGRSVGTAANSSMAGACLSPAFCRRTSLEERFREGRRVDSRSGADVALSHRRRLHSGVIDMTLAAMDIAASHHGIRASHPFFDRRLVEYALSLPSAWKLRDGSTRYALRAALGGIVPDEVRWRADKAAQVGAFVRRMAGAAARELPGLTTTVGGDWVDADKVARLCSRHDSAPDGNTAVSIWRIASVLRWRESVG